MPPLQGPTLPCSPAQEHCLFGLTPNHNHMMTSVCQLDAMGLQFLCESFEAIQRKCSPRPPPGYTTLKGGDLYVDLWSNSLISLQLLQNTSNLGTFIISPPQTTRLPSLKPGPFIEVAVTNVQASLMPQPSPSYDKMAQLSFVAPYSSPPASGSRTYCF